MNEELEPPIVLDMILARHAAWIRSLGTKVPSLPSAELDRQTLIGLWAGTSADLRGALAALTVADGRVVRALAAARQERPSSSVGDLGAILDEVRAVLRGERDGTPDDEGGL